MTAGQHVDSADMQDAIPSLVISGNISNDSSQPDGVQQSAEPGIGAVTVLLENGSCANPTSQVPISSTADVRGNFSFVSLHSGTYCISIRAGEQPMEAFCSQAHGQHQSMEVNRLPFNPARNYRSVLAGNIDRNNRQGWSPLTPPSVREGDMTMVLA